LICQTVTPTSFLQNQKCPLAVLHFNTKTAESVETFCFSSFNTEPNKNLYLVGLGFIWSCLE